MQDSNEYEEAVHQGTSPWQDGGMGAGNVALGQRCRKRSDPMIGSGLFCYVVGIFFLRSSPQSLQWPITYRVWHQLWAPLPKGKGGREKERERGRERVVSAISCHKHLLKSLILLKELCHCFMH